MRLQLRKGLPAPHERDELRRSFDLSLAPPDRDSCEKYVYRHFGFSFSVLICSELTDITYRETLRGKVDSLIVLCWNQDLETFAALIESAALDVHCYTALVNNRKYGDSRVRGPYKQAWKRDLVRVRGGLHDYFVITELDISGLREFQSFHESPSDERASFKPTPEGFRITSSRRRIPRGGY